MITNFNERGTKKNQGQKNKNSEARYKKNTKQDFIRI